MMENLMDGFSLTTEESWVARATTVGATSVGIVANTRVDMVHGVNVHTHTVI